MSHLQKNNVQLFAMMSSGAKPLFVPETAKTFSDLYDGLALGVYSALRTFSHNKFLCLSEHIERTNRSMTLLGWDYQLDEALLRRTLHEVCSAYPGTDMRVRFDVLRQPATQLGCDSRVLIALMPFTPPPPALYEQGVAVDYAPDLVRHRPLAKTAVFAQNRRRYITGSSDVYEHLMLDDNGRLLEGTMTNFYGVRDGIVYTAGEGVLEGITRQIILDLLAELDIPVRLEAIVKQDVHTLDEAFLSGSSRAVLPVIAIAEQAIGTARPGSIGRRLLMAYNQFVARSIKMAVTN